MSCGVGGKCGLDPALLWMWCRLESTALIQPLAWELAFAMGVALERQKKKQVEQIVEDITRKFL